MLLLLILITHIREFDNIFQAQKFMDDRPHLYKGLSKFKQRPMIISIDGRIFVIYKKYIL